MPRFQIVSSRPLLKKRFYSLKTSAEKVKKYKETIFLPQSNFPSFIKSRSAVERDEKIQEEANFLDFYSWQRKNLKGEFVLHDGPPYANGKPHIGHAVNKVLKDIILRSQVVQGTRVHFVPGWDCHGLPIEMTALKNIEGNIGTEKIRQKAREVAEEMSGVQMKAFKQWGVMGDWNNQCYYTFDKSYIINQLEVFWKLTEKGFIYHDKKPVYWSPSSKTALAEAELLYKNHKSLALTVRFEVVQNVYSEPLYLLIWTTTPWTVPLNQAVYCSPNIKYSVVKISSFPGLYVVATSLIQDLQNKMKAEIIEQSVISSKELINFKYRHPWQKNRLLNIYESPNISLLGTGLLHSVPGHGHEDYLLSRENKLKLECFVDEEGCYTSNAGEDLSGLKVLESNSVITERLLSEILLQEMYEHKYPFDWRTNEPVIIRASDQWFIDSDQLKDRAVRSLKEVEVPLKFFETKLQNRPYWCLSRQRKWGVPIPAFFHKTSGRPLLSKSLVHHICQLFESSGPDIWWSHDLETLFPKKFCEEFFIKIEDVIRGEDIMDIWFDSGISWSHVLNGKKSELYLEGEDQYSGWFQSSLLTSVAIKDEAPFKKIVTHGFVVDEDGKKMSKSLGNVVDPEVIIKGENAFGVDTLRWWVAYSSQNNLIPVSDRILQSNFESVQKLRLIFRFLLGAISDVSAEDVRSNKELTHLDRFLLNSCHQLYYSVMNYYNSHNFYQVCNKILHFITNEVSARYVHVIKDRLYCDQVNSARRRACQYTLNGILDTLSYVIAPILPHLIEEVYSYHPIHGGKRKFFYNNEMWTPPEFWEDDSADASIQLVDEIKAKQRNSEDVKSLFRKCCVIQVNEKEFELLKKMQGGEEQSVDSELTELLQVAEVHLKIGDEKITHFEKNSSVCQRCRRFTAPENEKLCERCLSFLS